jgi:TrpR-related protein YerC/YecD
MIKYNKRQAKAAGKRRRTAMQGKADQLGGDEVKRLFAAFCVARTPDEARAFLADICSPKEIIDLAQRLEVARMLRAGASYLEVSHATGASSTTVSRVSKCLNGAAGGYRMVLDRLDGPAKKGVRKR